MLWTVDVNLGRTAKSHPRATQAVRCSWSAATKGVYCAPHHIEVNTEHPGHCGHVQARTCSVFGQAAVKLSVTGVPAILGHFWYYQR